LFLALQKAQVHQKRNSYASSIAFLSLDGSSFRKVSHLSLFGILPIEISWGLYPLLDRYYSYLLKKPEFAKISV
jgi:hypothetical protein